MTDETKKKLDAAIATEFRLMDLINSFEKKFRKIFKTSRFERLENSVYTVKYKKYKIIINRYSKHGTHGFAISYRKTSKNTQDDQFLDLLIYEADIDSVLETINDKLK